MRILNPQQYALRKARILAIASSLFARCGYQQTSMESIAKACRMKKPSLYHYFKSKQELLRTLISEHMKKNRQKLAQALTGDMENALYTLGMKFLKEMANKSKREFFQIMFRDSAYDPYVRKVFLNGLQHKDEEMCGSFSHPECCDRSQFLMGMHQFMGSLVRYAVETRMWGFGLSTRFTDEEYIRSLARIFARGFRETPV